MNVSKDGSKVIRERGSPRLSAELEEPVGPHSVHVKKEAIVRRPAINPQDIDYNLTKQQSILRNDEPSIPVTASPRCPAWCSD